MCKFINISSEDKLYIKSEVEAQFSQLTPKNERKIKSTLKKNEHAQIRQNIHDMLKIIKKSTLKY